MSKSSAVVLWAMWLVGGASVAVAQQTVTLTSTADFGRGNNEGLVSTAQDRVTRDRITAGTVGAWSVTAALPVGRVYHSTVAYNGFVYAIGGQDADFSAPIDDVSVAPINADGSLGAWSATTDLPSGRIIHSSVAHNGFVYAIGGIDNFNVLSDVSVAPINANGSLGAWSASTALPSARCDHRSVVFNGFVYAIGGVDADGNVLSDVLVAPLNADGSVGAWSATTEVPSGRYAHSSVAYNGFVYAIGGYDAGSNISSDVSIAPINADGSLGAWSATTELPSGRFVHRSVVFNGFVYAIGGVDLDYNVSSGVLVASINADGSVGAWSASTELPSGRAYHSSVAYNGFVYAIAGVDGGYNVLSDVLVAPIDADVGNNNQAPSRLRGAYSHLVDLQSDTATPSVLLSGQLSPGGSIRLQVRLAPDATGVFGAETVVDSVALGTAIPVAGTGRYVWIRLTLDDTATSDVDSPTYISEITMGRLPPSVGVVFDGPGADIDTQTSTSTIEANWSGFTPSVGDSIDFYEWAIGTAPGLTNIQNWVNVGSATSASNSSLSLASGVKFVSVRATGSSGLTSAAATSDGVQVLPPPSAPHGDDDDDDKGRCGFGASASPGSGLALLGGLALLASALRRRERRR